MNAPSSTARAEQVHAELQAALRARHAADHAAAVLLAEVERGKLYRAFGHGSTIAYAMNELELPNRRARALLQLGRTAESLPAIDAAFAAGDRARSPRAVRRRSPRESRRSPIPAAKGVV